MYKPASESSFKEFVKKNTLMVIRMELEELPDKLIELTTKALSFPEEEKKILNDEELKDRSSIQARPDNIVQDEDGIEISEKSWLEEGLEDFYFSKYQILDFYLHSTRYMLIHFYYETYFNLKKRIGDELKKINLQTNDLRNNIFDFVYKTSKIEELNLIDNCIKHNNYLVSPELSQKFSQYVTNDPIPNDDDFLLQMQDIVIDAIKKINERFNLYY